MKLQIRHPDAEPYDLDDLTTLADAIEAEADVVASDAGSDQLEAPTQECRDKLKEQVIRDATRALRAPGDTYRDPLGIVWELRA
jgi:hypothetical protein